MKDDQLIEKMSWHLSGTMDPIAFSNLPKHRQQWYRRLTTELLDIVRSDSSGEV